MEASIPGIQLDIVPAIILIAFCIIMVALLASSEAGILSANKIKIKNLENNGDKRAKAVSDLMKSHEKLFATILTVENAFIIFASSISATVASGFSEFGAVISSFVMTILIVIFGEITPKTFAARNSELVALTMAIPIRFLVKILSYPIMLLTLSTKGLLILLNKLGIGSRTSSHDDPITEGEIRMMIDEGHLHQDEKELLQNVFEFGDEVVQQAMTPRTMIKAVPKNYTVKEALMEMLTYGHSKVPVYDESIDDIVGIIYLKELVNSLLEHDAIETESIEKYLKTPLFIPENKKIKDILSMMQQKNTQIFIVTDEYGGTEGLITTHDIMERIVGDIGEDGENSQNQSDFETLDDKTFVLNGTTTIEDIRDQLEIDIPEGSYQTISGFILQKLGKIPSSGEKFLHDNLEITISEVVGPKILKVTIIKH